MSGLRQPGAAFPEEDRAELLAEIEEETDRLDRLVTNLLDASRLEAGGLKLSSHPHDLAELFAAVLDRLQPRLGGRVISVEVPEDLPPITCDYAQIDQVVTNLFENAILHTPARRRRLTCARQSGARSVRVGGRRPKPGRALRGARAPVPAIRTRPDTRARLRTGADDCARIRRSPRWQAVARGRARLGSPLHFYAACSGRCDVSLSHPRVLVVDDEPQIRRALRLVLRANGYEVVEVGTGEAALELAHRSAFPIS